MVWRQALGMMKTIIKLGPFITFLGDRKWRSKHLYVNRKYLKVSKNNTIVAYREAQLMARQNSLNSPSKRPIQHFRVLFPQDYIALFAYKGVPTMLWHI